MKLTMRARDARRLFLPVIPHASTTGDIPVLETIKVTRSGDYWVATATDRYTLAVQRVPHRDLPCEADSFLVDAKAIAREVKSLPKSRAARDEVFDLDVTPIDAEYPRIGSIIGDRSAWEPCAHIAAVNPVFMGRFAAAAEQNLIRPREGVLLYRNSSGMHRSVLVTVSDGTEVDFVGCIMPILFPVTPDLSDIRWATQ